MHISGEARRWYAPKHKKEVYVRGVYVHIYIEVWDITERDYTQDKGEVPTDKRSTEWDILGDGTTPPTSRYIPSQGISLFRLYACSKLTPPMSLSGCTLPVTPFCVQSLPVIPPPVYILTPAVYLSSTPPTAGGIGLVYVCHSPLCVFPRFVWVEGS